MLKNIVKIKLVVALFFIYSCSEGLKKEKPKENIISHSEEKLNVLFIIADDLNCDLVYGNYYSKIPTSFDSQLFLFNYRLINFCSKITVIFPIILLLSSITKIL